MSRPDPIKLAETLRAMADTWRDLDAELLRQQAGSGRGGDPSTRVPFDVDVMDARRAIDAHAEHYAHILMDETKWTPRGDTGDILEALALRVEHFTHHEDAQIAYEFQTETEDVAATTASVVIGEDVGKWFIGVHCVEEGCGGWLTVTTNRDRSEVRHLGRMTARCDRDGKHQTTVRDLVANGYGREVADVV